MILIKLTGGLGNQLFQYAYGKSIALDKKEPLAFDLGWYKGRINRKYLLDEFCIDYRKTSWIKSLFLRYFKKEKCIRTDMNSSWLTLSYPEKNRELLKKEIVLKSELSEYSKNILEKINSTNSVSIHLRGGDYVRGNKSSFHGVCSREYYEMAIDLIRQRVYSPTFFIFTDDIDWAKQYIKLPGPHIFVSQNSNLPQEELILMSRCKHNIIANSTFSWWGAWLNNNQDKMVISPRKWFNDESIDTSELIPQAWIKI